eukprot:TRINITY_DN96101_c0_g1_i1.p1 TRINITY_DN96101_c0_g1~~TRINITY_DN96101_c0_g1_i1.p1  ORF type:complete len:349 (-),score=74.33 TRINITY_DN96101_c0_g1_i1:189-1235(-)
MQAVASPAHMKASCVSPYPTSAKPASPASSVKASPAAQYERLESNIGEGTYGKVHKAQHMKSKQIVAIKKAKVSAADRDVGGIGFTALREIKVMQAVKHPNVMGCLDVYADGGIVHLVMEFMDGDLKKVIEDRSLVILEVHSKCLAKQLLDGLGALHERWLVHRDVTPQNVLLNFHTGIAKIGDFGFTRTLGHAGDRPMTGMCTTLWYRAPELLFGAKHYGQAVDLWSAGCVIAETFRREALFPARGEFDMVQRVVDVRGTPKEDTWKDVSALPTFIEFTPHPQAPMEQVLPNATAAARSLIDVLLVLDPKKRPSAAEALQHEFFTTAWPKIADPLELPFVKRWETQT